MTITGSSPNDGSSIPDSEAPARTGRALPGRCVIYQNQFFQLYSGTASFGSCTREYVVADYGVRVGALVLRGNDVLLVRQYRFLIDGPSWEIPGGGIRAGESPEAAVLRECREESGIECRVVEPLYEFDMGLDITYSHGMVYCCRDFTDLGTLRNTETDARAWVPLEECVQRVFAREILENMTVLTLLWFTHPQRRPTANFP